MNADAFDKDALLEELDDDWEFLEESVAMMREDASGLLERMRLGHEQDDAEAVWQSAHTVKSMVGNFAAGPTFEIAYRIETRGRANELEAINADIDELDAELQRLANALEALLTSARG